MNKQEIYKNIKTISAILVLFFIVFVLFKIAPDYKGNTIVNDFNIKQISSLPGEPIKWIKTVSISEINKYKHFIEVPEIANNVKVSTTTLFNTKTQSSFTNADRIKLSQLSKDRSKSEASLTLAESIKAQKAKGFFASINRTFSKVGSMFATVDESVTEPEMISVDVLPIVETPEEAILTVEEETSSTTEEIITPTEEQSTSTEEIITEESTATRDENIEEIISTSTEEEIATTTIEEQPTTSGGSSGEENNITDIISSSTESNLLASSTATTTELVVVEYETPAPTIAEAVTDTGKIVTISATDTLDVPITNVLAFTNIPEIYKVGQEDKIKIKWSNNGDQNVIFKAYDLNNNGKLDYVEWIVPHLSTQTFEIIFISKAFQLDSNKEIISDIYDTVKEQDNIWAPISDGQYVRVTFEKILNNQNDITIYTRPASSTPVTIEAYSTDTNQLVATFNITEEGLYKELIPDLQSPTDVFDLKIIGEVEIDYVVDPTVTGFTAYYDMNDTDGTTVIDSSGNNRNGTGTYTPGTGIIDGALEFDGVDDYVGVNYEIPRASTTISFWVKSLRNDQGIMQISAVDYKYVSYTDRAFMISPAGNIIFDVYSSGEVLLYGGYVGDGEWHHILATWDNSGKSLYVDSILVDTAIGGMFPVSPMPYITIGEASVGGVYGPANPFFKGSIDDLTIYTKVLSQEEINTLYTEGNVVTSSDTTPPAITVTSPTNGSVYNPPSINFNVSATDETSLGFIVPDLDSSLISWWRMDDKDGSIITDYNGNNNGTAYGASQTTGKFGKGISFNGIDNYISIPHSSDFDVGSNDFTFSTWFYPTSNASQAIFASDTDCKIGVSYSYPAGSKKLGIWAGNGSGCWGLINSDGGGNGVGTITMEPNNWYHIIYQREGSTFRTYINGVLDLQLTNITGSIVTRNEPFVLGRWGAPSVRLWNSSKIDEFLFFNRALVTDEITALYNGSSISHTPVLDLTSHTYKAYSSDLAGNISSSTLNNFLFECETITTDGDYTVHTFICDKNFTIDKDVDAEVLVVAGGGGGGKAEPNLYGDGAGGGGGGGLIHNNSYSINTGVDYSVSVGNGGLGSTINSAKGGNGSNSSFDSLIAIGGGGGGSDNHDLTGANLGANGGSGGGSASMHTNQVPGSLGTADQGNNGGATTIRYGAGGGGAGTAGSNSIAGTGAGAGGEGLSYSISGTTIYYAGGGGGGAGEYTDSRGLGGSGVGGNGGIRGAPGANAVANTGSGGGGGGTNDNNGNGGNGSKGVVIIRYLTDVIDPVITVISPTNGSTYNTSSINFNVSATDETSLGNIIPDLDSSLISWWRMDDIFGGEVNTEGTKTYDGNYTIRTFDYIGSDQTFIAPSTGDIIVKAWGAGGGGGSNAGTGGGGGYASSTISVVAGQLYTIVVGRGGSAIAAAGGTGPLVYGGGGQVQAGWGGQGGGLSGLFSESSLINFNNTSQSRALLVAGGGGGGSWENMSGGAGGGLVGVDGQDGSDLGGKGGSQFSGGSGKVNPQSYGSALQGGAVYGDDTGGGGGGGGGYFGGGGGSNYGNGSAGGGGSGYYVSNGVTIAGSGVVPGNSADSDRGTAGNGGINTTSGSNGKVIVKYQTPEITVYDYMGRNNGTTVVDVTNFIKGRFGRALNLIASSSNYVQINKSLDSSLPITWSIWVKSDFADYQNTIFNHNYSPRISSQNYGSQISAYYNSIGDCSVSLTSTINDNVWHNLTFVRAENSFRVFVDGVSNGSAVCNPTGNSSVIEIGKEAGSSSYLNGSVDDAMIFNRALTVEEIKGIYDGTALNYNTNIVDGSHTYQAFAQDLIGNISSSTLTTFNVTSDNTNPTSTISTPTNNSYSTSTTVSLTGTSSDTNLSATTISVDGGSFIATEGTASSWTYSATGLSQGTHTFQTKATDLAGNVGLSSSINIIVDSIYPNTSTNLTWSQTSPYNDTAITAIWTKSDSVDLANQRIQLYTGATCNTPTGSLIDLVSTTTQTRGFTGTDNTTYTFKITSIDTATNETVSDCSSSMQIVLDNIPPTTVTNLNGYTTNTWTNNTVTVDLTCQDNEGGSGCDKIYTCIDSGSVCDPTLGTSYSSPKQFTYSTEGTTTLRWKSKDLNGNWQTTEGIAIVKIDTSDPSVDIGTNKTRTFTYTQISTTSDAISGIASYLWSSDVNVIFGATTSESTTISASTEGNHIIRLTVIDNAGNSLYDEYTLVWDSTSPIVSNISPVEGSNISRTNQSIDFTISENGDCRLSTEKKSYDDMSADVSCTSNSLLISCILPSFISSGVKDIYIACNDSFGNKDTASTTTHISYRIRSSVGAVITTEYPITVENIFNINTSNSTDSRIVTLNITPNTDTKLIVISNNPDFNRAITIPVQTTYDYNLCQTNTTCPDGEYTIYARSLDIAGVALPAVSITVTLSTKSIIEKITDIITEVVTPAPVVVLPPISVTEEDQDNFNNNIGEIIPSELTDLSYKNLPTTFKNIINMFPDITANLQNINITTIDNNLSVGKVLLPGISEYFGLSLNNVLISNFTFEQSKKLPSDLIFARTVDESIDLNVKLSVSNEGLTTQTLNTIQGQTIKFVVKPDAKAKRVDGYLMFKAPYINQTASVLEATEEKELVVNKFDYKDNGNGVWTAEVTSPYNLGQYELKTVISFEDKTKAQRELSMIVLVDPEGYVYRKIGNEEVRIKNSVVSIFWNNPTTSTYELWPADNFKQKNPQITDVTGRYSFLVPIGDYYLSVIADGYSDYQSESFKVEESKGVFMNIEMKKKFAWKNLINLQNILLSIITLILVYFLTISVIRRGKKIN